MTNIEKTLRYLQYHFDNTDYFKEKPLHKEYRLNHTYRVAKIGQYIASHEGLNVEAAVIGCLLHDISYVLDFDTIGGQRNHGRAAAKMAREFLQDIEMDEDLKDQILYGIAIHVDDEADFEGKRTPLAELIGESDNIDRFDAYRLYEGLLYSELKTMTLLEQISFSKDKVKRLIELKDTYVFKTATSNKLWNEKLDYQINYYKRLYEQLLLSDPLELNMR